MLFIKGNDKKQLFTPSVNTMMAIVDTKAKEGWNCYYGVATFKKKGSRKAENVGWMKSLWVDVDCGEDKDYKTKKEGLQAIIEFTKQVGFRIPWIVDSGRGYHVYYAFTEEVEAIKWLSIVGMLRAAMIKFGFKADYGCSSDQVRVLRCPGSQNVKNPDNPLDVKVIQEGVSDDYESVRAKLQALDLAPAKPAKKHGKIGGLTGALAGEGSAHQHDTQSRFSTIAKLSLKGKGCAQIKRIVMEQDKIPEPLWRAGLSIAQACVDRDTAIHIMSNKHPEYNKDETEEKASATAGPYTCEVFAGLDPIPCDTCPHDITSPILLGKEVARADPIPEEVVKEATLSIEKAEQPLYNPPHPYFRGKSGGVYVTEPTEDGTIDRKVYPYDLYAVTRIVDPHEGDCVVLRLHLPNDGLREFTIPMSTFQDGNKAKIILARNGVNSNAKEMNEIMAYTIKYVQELQRKQRALDAKLQFGWSPNADSFVVGHREYTKKGINKNFPASTTRNIIDHLDPKGSLEIWQQAINCFAQPGLEAQAFAALAGFGSPLVRFSGVTGGVISLVSNESGTGKTTAARVASAVWGNPDGLMLNATDTYNVRFHRMGIMHNIVTVFDEITNLIPIEISNVCYQATHGRAKGGMKSSGIEERLNFATWNNLLVTTSNSSVADKVASLKDVPDGELARILELPVKQVFVPQATSLFEALNANYGHAGDIYAKWLVEHVEEIPEMVHKERQAIKDLVGDEPRERYWAAIGAVIFTGAKIATDLGLISLPLDHIKEWYLEIFNDSRANVKSHQTNADTILAEFLAKNTGKILIVKDKMASSLGDPQRLPTQGVMVRFEADQNQLYIAKSAFREYCFTRQVTMNAVLDAASKKEADLRHLGTRKKRMLANTGVPSPTTDALVFHCTDAVLGGLITLEDTEND